MPAAAYRELTDRARELALLKSIDGLLGWDERTTIPPRGVAYRAEQITYVAGLIHRRQTNPRLGDLFSELSDSPLAADPHSDTGSAIRCLRDQYDRKTKLPQQLVEDLARTAAEGQQVWTEARKKDDFNHLRPVLEKTVKLKRDEAEAVGYEDCRYDALLQEYEPREKTCNIQLLLTALRDALLPLLESVDRSPRRPNSKILSRSYPVERQKSLGRKVATRIGFDFRRGRLDVTAHPFCTGLGPHDTRITTRYDENQFCSALFGTLHEAGHGIYEQGLREEWYGLPPGEPVSLGIHESQSRLWENLVGRSRAFWKCFYPSAQDLFTHSLRDVDLDEFYAAVNDVRPSLIRVEADEATYNLHILVRFELEQSLVDGDLSVADLPQAWNEKYQQHLGIQPHNQADGVLQDIHWSAGLFGYFPTYSLGNLYASQFYRQADQDLGGLPQLIERGEFAPLAGWLRDNIHRRGRCYSAAQLVELVTGTPLSHQDLILHLRSKLQPLYGTA